jgi:hypothetical protein
MTMDTSKDLYLSKQFQKQLRGLKLLAQQTQTLEVEGILNIFKFHIVQNDYGDCQHMGTIDVERNMSMTLQ